MTGAKRTAVVTGAARGIGEAVSRQLVAEGWWVHGLDTRAVEIEGVMGHVVDLSDPAAIERFGADCSDPIHALVNNAAVQGGAPVADQTLNEWQHFLDVNVTAPWLLVKTMLPQFVDGGSIVNIGSVASVTGFANRTAYCASKHALVGLTKALASELAPRGIRVNLLVLGTIETPRLLEIAGDRRESFAARQLLGRMGRTDEAADAALYLLSERASFITGTTIAVDGGMLVKGATG